MAELPGEAEDSEKRLQECLDRLASGDPHARDDLIAIACSRMQGLAHRMLLSYPAVRRHEGTDDVVQNAAMRLYRALAEVRPASLRHFSGLAALQIRRELLDLARKHAGPESYAANHETNYARVGGEERAKVSDAPAGQIQIETLEEWTRLHEAAASLPEEERELFHVVWYLGAKQDEAATLLNCSERTVKRRWANAKRLIAMHLRGESPPVEQS
jgi:RNA polymerase sigma factor (sigma-70 family)